MTENLAEAGPLPAYAQPTLESWAEWYVMGGKCSKCGHQGWVDRWELRRLYGRNKYIVQLRPLLRCRLCGNVGDNEWIVGKAAR